jgi:serine protease Do
MKTNVKKILMTLAIAFAGALFALIIYSVLIDNKTRVVTTRETIPVTFTGYSGDGSQESCGFCDAAEKAVHAVVHVKTESKLPQEYQNPIYEFFYGQPYGGQSEPVVGYGSGVIISSDGYIVTNNHVIDKSDKITVILNDKREFEAKLIGTDPSSDLALIKVDGKDLPLLEWGDSETLRLGEWVLAVGNPYNLTSTVTAGIVSAKGRSLGIIQDQYRLESYIQTDAALNPGNSGGALVNIKGQLVGINAVIISPSGGYAGNSFAIPVSIVKKIVTDLKEYGKVQRAVLGVTIQDVDAQIAKENNLAQVKGVYVNGLKEQGAAKESGIEVGDVIIKIDEVVVNSTSELQEQISKFTPNDTVLITLIRDNKEKQFDVVLRNMQGEAKVITASLGEYILGAKFEVLSAEDKSKFGVRSGLKIIELTPGKFKDEGIKEGFIIIQVNNRPVYTVDDLKKIVDSTSGGIYIEGIYPNGVKAYYAFGL